MAGRFFNKTNTPLNLAGYPKIEFKMFGRWDEAIRTINTLSPKIKIASLIAQMKVCEEIKKRVKKHLMNQDLPWPPLSASYLARKDEMGYSSRTLIATKKYYESIEVWQKGNQHFAFVGVRKGIYTKNISGRRSRIDVASIAAIHEFSSGARIPKRPLWNPTIAEYGGSLGIKVRYTYYLAKALKFQKVPIKEIRSFLK